MTEPHFPVIQNQGFASEINRSYNRFPSRSKSIVNPRVWSLSQDSSGLAIYFKTNSPIIEIRYICLKNFSKFNMAAIGVSGIDLLSKTATNKWIAIQHQYKFDSNNHQVTYIYNETRKSNPNDPFEYHLYLPLYNTIENLEIGVKKDFFFQFIEKVNSKPIVIYGTSIVQGCCVPRPIDTWSNIIQRHFNVPVLNFGFSNSARLEEEVVNLVTENEAVLYVIDCLPNCYEFDVETVKRLVLNALNIIRKKWLLTPILLVEFAGLNHEETDKESFDRILNTNLAQRSVYEKKVEEGEKNIFYLSKEEIGFDSSCFTDFIHPNSYGMVRYAKAYIQKLNQIFNISPSNKFNYSFNLNSKSGFSNSICSFNLYCFLYILIMLSFILILN